MRRHETRLITALPVVAALLILASPVSASAGAAGAAPLLGPAAAGATRWVSRYDGPSHRDDGATSMAMSNDGTTVFVAGSSTGRDPAGDILVIAYRADTGTARWTARYDGPAHGFDGGTRIATVPGRSIVVVSGPSRGPGTQLDYATIAYDAGTGARLWTRRYDAPAHANDYPTAIAADAQRVYVTGYGRVSAQQVDELTVAYDATTGKMLWHRRYDGPGHGSDQARGIAVSADASRVYVVGSSPGSHGDADIAIQAYATSTGRSVWQARYDGPGHNADMAEDIVATPDGEHIFVTGESIGTDGGWDEAVVAYDGSHARPSWVRRYSGPAQRDDYPTALALSPDASSVYVTGYSTGLDNSFDYATVAYATNNGLRRWVGRYAGPAHGSDDAEAVAVSPDANLIVVTGASIGPTGATDYATVAYRASTGAQVWVRRYRGGTLNDYAYDVAVSPDSSHVFVTGESSRPAGDQDAATLAYSLR